MNRKSLTVRESQVMNIIWSSDIALSASQIQQLAPELSIYTVQQVVQKLLKKEFIKVDSIVQNKKVLMRLFTYTMTQAEYLEDILSKKNSFDIASAFVEKSEDIDSLKSLSDMISQRLKELEN